MALYQETRVNKGVLLSNSSTFIASMEIEENTQAQIPQLTRSSDVWFDDGTVVLQAETTLFRVYRGVLVAQSPIFRDTFAIPQPPAQEMYEGCPVILLHDSPGDLELFLLATHDAGYVNLLGYSARFAARTDSESSH